MKTQAFRDDDLPKPGDTWAYVGTGPDVTVKEVTKREPFCDGTVKYFLEEHGDMEIGIVGFLLNFTLVREGE